MSYDNKIFNVNGHTDQMLLNTLKLVFDQDSHYYNQTAEGWKFSAESGFILLWYTEANDNKFPVPLDAEMVFPMIKEWLKSDEAKGMSFNGWDADADHDGHNGIGWRVHRGEWGNIDGHSGAICAIRPAYVWFGK